MARKTSDKKASAPEGKKPAHRLPLPSDNPATNLLIADIVLRGASTLLRRNVEERVVKASSNDAKEAKAVLDGRTLITSLGLYGASKIATRSVPGLVLVTGGLVLKTLYDRGKARQSKTRQNKAHQHRPIGTDAAGKPQGDKGGS